MTTHSSLADMPRAIAHDVLMALPVLRYTGPIHLVTTPAELAQTLAALRHDHVLGCDTETRPTFHKGQSHNPSLVQIAGSRAVYLFQLARLDCAPALTEIFSNPRIVKTGVALQRALSDLKKLFPFEAANVIDIGDVAKRHGLEQSGVRNLAGLFLGGRITKGARTTNWANPTLTPSQIRYAATDAWICRELYLHFDKLGLLTPPPPKPKPARHGHEAAQSPPHHLT